MLLALCVMLLWMVLALVFGDIGCVVGVGVVGGDGASDGCDVVAGCGVVVVDM